MPKYLRTPKGLLYRITRVDAYPEDGDGEATYWSHDRYLDDVTLLNQAPHPVWDQAIGRTVRQSSETTALDVKHPAAAPMADPEPLARQFCDGLRTVLTDHELATIRDRNRHETEPGVCHTHDFIDANLIMLAAWEHLDLPTRYGSPHPDHYALWGAAWQTAMDWEFTPPTTP